jgi:hypothetical protein
MKKYVGALAVLILCGGVGHFAQSAAPERPAAGPLTWREFGLQEGLTEAELARLKTDGVIVSGEALKQIFEAYTWPPAPMFITTDSILYGFHVLFEESVLRLEQANAGKLQRLLWHLWNGLATVDQKIKLDPSLVADAKRRAQTVIGVALKLVARDRFDPGPKLRGTIKEECARIDAAEGRSKPAWLGPPDPGFLAIDYTSFKPRGFYGSSPQMRDYFRALRWLQRIPFRIQKDEEFLAVMMMGNLLSPWRRDRQAAEEFERYLRNMRRLGGTADDYDLDWISVHAQNTDRCSDLAKERQPVINQITHYSEGPAIQDQLRFVPWGPEEVSEANCRIISASRLPDAVQFQKSEDSLEGDARLQFMPEGLDVAAAFGSEFARARVLERRGQAYLGGIDAINKKYFNGGDIGSASPFVDSYGLYGVTSIYLNYLRCLETLLDAPDPGAPALMRSPLWQMKSCNTALAGWAEMRHTWILQAKENATIGGVMMMPAGFVEPEPEFYSKFGNLVGEVYNLLSRAKAWEPANTPASMDAKWSDLKDICRRLESLSHKQLRGLPFNNEEEDFIKGYGDRLGHIMLYESNSYEEPRDDAMRIVDVYANPNLNEILEVGVGRPRRIWVLYPTAAGDVLCQGAVMPYYEFASENRLTDEEWRKVLDSGHAPDVPDWSAPLFKH